MIFKCCDRGVSLHLAIIHIAYSFGFTFATMGLEGIAGTPLIGAFFRQLILVRLPFGLSNLHAPAIPPALKFSGFPVARIITNKEVDKWANG